MDIFSGVLTEKNYYQGKKILITGHTGFKGSWLTLILKRLGACVFGYSSNEECSERPFFSMLHIENLNDYRGDICDVDTLKKIINDNEIEFVFHLAAQAIVKNGIDMPIETFRVNALGTASILEACRECSSVRGILIVTTDKVYKNEKYNKTFDEYDVIWGESPYSASKCCAELVVDSYRSTFYSQLDVGIAVVRAGNVIGGGDFAPYRIIPDCVRAWVNDEILYLRSPNSIRPYQHVLDVLFAYCDILQLVCTKGARYDVYNVGPANNQRCTTMELVKMFFDELGVDKEVQINQINQFYEDQCISLDCHKLVNDLGYSSLLNICEAVKMTAKWYKAWQLGTNINEESIRQIEYYIEKRGMLYGRE